METNCQIVGSLGAGRGEYPERAGQPVCQVCGIFRNFWAWKLILDACYWGMFIVFICYDMEWMSSYTVIFGLCALSFCFTFDKKQELVLSVTRWTDSAVLQQFIVLYENGNMQIWLILQISPSKTGRWICLPRGSKLFWIPTTTGLNFALVCLSLAFIWSFSYVHATKLAHTRDL